MEGEKRRKRTGGIWEELELGLGGGKKLRVLIHLALNPDKAFTKYALAKYTGLRTPSVDRRLKTLVELGWVKENRFKPKTYQINVENETVKTLLDFLAAVRKIKGYPPPPPNFSQIT
ncbi:MAG: MarR family transcriptional regulator [Candidatus Bathyarchaeota archaeon]|nr:MarR family transcriptional regulator [Candidatus Bathyarchaeota archaeon]